jgi:hypothetical protein
MLKFSDPNPVSVSLIFQPKLNAQTQFQYSFKKNLAENKLQNRNMRILNIVLSAEIKYQQHAKLRKFIDT